MENLFFVKGELKREGGVFYTTDERMVLDSSESTVVLKTEGFDTVKKEELNKLSFVEFQNPSLPVLSFTGYFSSEEVAKKLIPKLVWQYLKDKIEFLENLTVEVAK